MPRAHRMQLPGFVRHVVARGNGRMTVFRDDIEYAWFVGLLADVVDTFALECWSYCLMPNHYHLVIRPTLPNLSESIQMLNGRYAQWWNRRNDHVGHVFQGRFKDQIVQEDRYLRTLSRYVALNPVRASLTMRPEEWVWSSYRAIVGLAPCPSYLAADSVLRFFGGADDPVRNRFAEFVMTAATNDRLVADIRSRCRVLGDSSFVRYCRVSARNQAAGSVLGASRLRELGSQTTTCGPQTAQA